MSDKKDRGKRIRENIIKRSAAAKRSPKLNAGRPPGDLF